MRVCIVEPRSTGGMIHYAYQLADALAGAGLEVSLVTATDYELAHLPHRFKAVPMLRLWTLYSAGGRTDVHGTLAKLAYRLTRLVQRGIRALRLVREWLRLTGYLLRERPDIIQFGKIEFPFEGIFLAYMRARGLCLTQVCHEFESREQGVWGAVISRFYTGVYGNFAFLFFHAESNRARFMELYPYPPERTAIIPHGNEGLFVQEAKAGAVSVDLRERYGIPAGVPVVLFFGNLTASKGLPDLLQAFARLDPASGARLLVAGYPTKFIDMDELHQMTGTLGITARVVFDSRYIPVEEVAAIMGLSAVVVYPYRSATQSGSLQVAYAFARPVIATRVGGLPDVVEEGRSGLLVEPENPVELAAAIEQVLADPTRAHQMGEYAHHLSETRFAWSSIAGQIREAYERLLASGR
ncbi:MAG: glycosyltransferase family 4 protein [Anaerolineae bacterium]|nr:glycosyltransferase family 4 protein [Anaerolineae bacterium]